jgi:signal transduction histidine kinase
MQLVLDAYYELRETKALERSEQLAAVGELAASIAHEVRNPLAGMRGALEILQRDGSMKSGTLDVVAELIGQIDRMEGLVRDLLEFASPRPLAPRAFDLHELMDRLLASYQDRAAAAGITLERRYAPKSNRIVADPQRMEQVFFNLLENAFQAMDSGGALTVQIAGTGRETIVRLADEGHGIAPEVLPQIFQPFYTTKHRGSGLGLSIVRSIVTSHGGTIDVQSKLGEGTIVELRLPGAAVDR